MEKGIWELKFKRCQRQRHPRIDPWGIVLCVWPSKKVILQGGKQGKMAQWQSLDWTLKMLIKMTKQLRFWNAHDLASNLFVCSLFATSAHPPIMIRLMWKGPSIITNSQRSSISTATLRINWWIETWTHQLKVVEYLLSLGYCFLRCRVSIWVACNCNTWLVNACEAFTG